MLRTLAVAEERPWLALGAIFAVTLFFGFVTQAAGSLYLRLTHDAIDHTYRTTLSYTSAPPSSVWTSLRPSFPS